MSSLEALELRAAAALGLDADERRARALGEPPADASVPFPDARGFASASARALPDDPWRAALLAEAHLAASRRRPLRALTASLPDAALALRHDAPAVPWERAPSAIATEPSAPRRALLSAAADARAPSLHPGARGVVDALRAALDALPPQAAAAMALGDDDHADVADATDDLLRELDAWARRALELPAATLSWADRLRSLAGTATLSAAPPATWVSLGARVFLRAGLDDAPRAVHDDLRPASREGVGVAVCVRAPGERAAVAGRALLGAWGLGEVTGAVAEASATALGKGPFPGVRRGCDRAVDGVAHALGRRLALDRRFLAREAGVEGASRERVMLEQLHAEVLRARLDAALSRAVAHALARRPEAGQRFHAEVTRALGVSPPPAWAPWAVAWCFDGHGLWSARPAGRSLGAKAELRLHRAMCERYDEDWFRNPRAGEGLAAALTEMRAVGVRAWCEAHGGVPDGRALVARLGDALREARRAS